MSSGATTIFLVDDDPAVLRSAARLLQTAGHSVETFCCAAEFLSRPPFTGVGCLITDMQMPGLDGLELQKAVVAAGSLLPVIFLTGHGDVPSTVKAMKAGAVDFLIKPFECEELLEVVATAVAKHERLLVDSHETEELERRFRHLTAREREVCILIGRGLLNKQIAAELGTAEGTVKIHRARVIRKLALGACGNPVAELARVLDRIQVS